MTISCRLLATAVVALAAGSSASLQTAPQTQSPQDAVRPIDAGDSPTDSRT